jgi:hypothetical protein
VAEQSSEPVVGKVASEVASVEVAVVLEVKEDLILAIPDREVIALLDNLKAVTTLDEVVREDPKAALEFLAEPLVVVLLPSENDILVLS